MDVVCLMQVEPAEKLMIWLNKLLLVGKRNKNLAGSLLLSVWLSGNGISEKHKPGLSI